MIEPIVPGTVSLFRTFAMLKRAYIWFNIAYNVFPSRRIRQTVDTIWYLPTAIVYCVYNRLTPGRSKST